MKVRDLIDLLSDYIEDVDGLLDFDLGFHVSADNDGFYHAVSIGAVGIDEDSKTLLLSHHCPYCDDKE